MIPKTVVFAVLHSNDSTRFVRVYENYPVNNFDPLTHTVDTQVKNAIVTVTPPGTGPVVFSDTLLKRVSTDRYTDSILAYYSRTVIYQASKAYHLSVINPRLGEVHADLVTPDIGRIDIISSFSIRQPDQADEDIRLILQMPSPYSGGYILKMFLEFQIDTLSQTVTRKWEIPVAISSNGELVFPVLKGKGDQNEILETFTLDAYRLTRAEIKGFYNNFNLRYLRAIFELYQFDVHLYNYYSLVNGFRDPLSLRSDSPDYTNLINGLGIFGAITINSTTEENLP
jgi:hypothetical protein